MRAPFLGVCAAIAIVAPAHAESDKAKAKRLYEEGLKHYNVAEWEPAVKAWKEAYLLSKRPLLLFNIAQAYRLAGDCKQAMVFYDSYQREEPAPKNPDELDQAVALCKEKLAAKPGDPPPNTPVDKADLTLTDKPNPTAANERPVDQPPDGPTTPATTVATVSAPAEVPGRDGLGEPPAPEGRGGTLRTVGIGVGVAGAVLGGIGIYFALDSKSASDELDGWTMAWTPTQVDLEARGQSSEKKAWIFGGAGVAALAAGAVLFAIGGPEAAESNTVTVVPTRGGAQVGWSARF